MATDKKKNRKIISVIITLSFLISPLSSLRAEDYPAGFLGPGYREYLTDKKQNGYYVDVFAKIDLNQKERVNKRNQIEEILTYAYQAAPESAHVILATKYQQIDNTDNLKREIIQRRLQREKFAATNVEAGFRYVPHSDGKTEYFKDGLLIRVENERVVDEFGNLNIRNSYNYQYDDKRLLKSFEADTKDHLGNIAHIRQYGMQYTADSLFYANKDTNVNKNIIEYFIEETDPAGNKKLTHFYGGSYAGKFLRAFSETIKDSIYGESSFTRSDINYAGGDPTRLSSYHEQGRGTDDLPYTLDRTNISYNDKDQLTGYHEEIITTQLYGGKVKTTVDAQFKYLGVEKQFGPDVEEPDPDRLLESIITTTAENPDGSAKTETNTTTYKYDGTRLTGASGQSEFKGQEAKWWEYQDQDGHILTKATEGGNEVYFYVNPGTREKTYVSLNQVTSTLKDGNKYSGTTEIQHEITYGKPMAKKADSITSYYGPTGVDLLRKEKTTLSYNNGLVNNLARLLNIKELTNTTHYPLVDPNGLPQIGIKEITTNYTYKPNGNLDQVQGEGKGSGYEFTNDGWINYASKITVDYEVILGETKQKQFAEIKDYKNQ